MRLDEIHLNSLILPPHVKRCQTTAVEVASPAVEAIPLAAGRTVVWAGVDIDAVVHLLDKYQAPVGVVDTPARRFDKAGLVAGIAEAEVDLP
jgi:hypothetical protein